MKTRFFFLILLTILLSSCGAMMNSLYNPYNSFSKIVDDTKYKNVRNKNRVVYKYTDDEDIKYFLKRGYIVKATSAFRYSYIDRSWLELAAKRFGSEVVLSKRQHAGTRRGVQALRWRVPGDTYRATSRTNGSVSYNSNTNSYVYSSNGSAAYGRSSTYGGGNYSSTTTTIIQGPDKYKTQYVPYSRNFYNYFAVFLVKKYYSVNYPVKVYKNRRLTHEDETLKSNEWFEVIKKKKNFIKISYRGKEGFIPGNVSIR